MRRSILLLGAVLLAAAASAPQRTIDRAASRIGFRGVAGGRPFTGVFKRWEAMAAIDPADLSHARLSLSLEVASGVTGDPVRDRTLPARLEAPRFPRVGFESRTVTAAGAGRLLVDGVLRLKGAAKPVTWTFMATPVGRDLRLDGALPLEPSALGAPASLTARLLLRAPR